MSSQPLLTNADFYFPVGVFFEAFFFGIYTVLFIVALWIWQKRRSRATVRGFSGVFYLIVTILMWIVAGLHLGLSMERYLRIFILELRVGGPSTSESLQDGTVWDMKMHLALTTVMTWLGDILVLYRTFIVWNRNFWIISLPVLIQIAYLFVNTIATCLVTHPTLASPSTTYKWYLPVFPLVFAQNTITTGLLTYKVWSQHRSSSANGVINAGGSLSLGHLAKIIIETVMLYPLELFIIIVLGIIQHPAKRMVILWLSPTIGIAFVLLSVRVHFGVSFKTNGARSTTASSFPNLFRDSVSDGGIELERPVPGHSIDRIDLEFKTGDDKLTLHHSDTEAEDRDPFPTASFSRKNSAEGLEFKPTGLAPPLHHSVRDAEDARAELARFRQELEGEQRAREVASLDAQRAVEHSLLQVMFYGYSAPPTATRNANDEGKSESLGLNEEIDDFEAVVAQLRGSIQEQKVWDDSGRDEQLAIIAALRVDKREQIREFMKQISAVEDRQAVLLGKAKLLVLVTFFLGSFKLLTFSFRCFEGWGIYSANHVSMASPPLSKEGYPSIIAPTVAVDFLEYTRSALTPSRVALRTQEYLAIESLVAPVCRKIYLDFTEIDKLMEEKKRAEQQANTLTLTVSSRDEEISNAMAVLKIRLSDVKGLDAIVKSKDKQLGELIGEQLAEFRALLQAPVGSAEHNDNQSLGERLKVFVAALRELELSIYQKKTQEDAGLSEQACAIAALRADKREHIQHFMKRVNALEDRQTRLFQRFKLGMIGAFILGCLLVLGFQYLEKLWSDSTLDAHLFTFQLENGTEVSTVLCATIKSTEGKESHIPLERFKLKLDSRSQ
ncbi:hypothetical protein CVT24_008431 [Panaeolus cyanescens]|uniref:Uncharacterized protein n=1 Tax=Panaeolus cyanescens TaxID=181874 RepID=A0A409VBK3_9AGAR|nr:hypothetical protein CVT24_008431 [Panaeolus cyanescens]